PPPAPAALARGSPARMHRSSKAAPQAPAPQEYAAPSSVMQRKRQRPRGAPSRGAGGPDRVRSPPGGPGTGREGVKGPRGGRRTQSGGGPQPTGWTRAPVWATASTLSPSSPGLGGDRIDALPTVPRARGRPHRRSPHRPPGSGATASTLSPSSPGLGDD